MKALLGLAFVSLFLLSCPVAASAQEVPQAESGKIYRPVLIKTNLLTYGAFVASLGAEWHFAKHFSAGAMAYYTAIDWAMQTNIKFRIKGIQPEFRYWFRPDGQGFFVNAHATVASFNFALAGRYRYQDPNQPAWGGGVGGGFHFALSSNPRSHWEMEIMLGAGVISARYNIYYNVPNGRKAGEDSRFYFGPDQAAITLIYRIGGRNK